MIAPSLREIFSTDDGSLPVIAFDFHGKSVAAVSYGLIQELATALISEGAYYWSKSRQAECPIQYGDNPAVQLLNGDAEPFHVVFGGLESRSGRSVPDLGLFVLGEDSVALDYRMGPGWTDSAIEGLVEFMTELANLAPGSTVNHEGNQFDPDGQILCTEFRKRSAPD